MESFKFPSFEASLDVKAVPFELKTPPLSRSNTETRVDTKVTEDELINEGIDEERDVEKVIEKDTLDPSASKADLANVTQGMGSLSLALSLGKIFFNLNISFY